MINMSGLVFMKFQLIQFLFDKNDIDIYSDISINPTTFPTFLQIISWLGIIEIQLNFVISTLKSIMQVSSSTSKDKIVKNVIHILNI